MLSYRGLVTHIFVLKLGTIGSDNDMAPVGWQTIIWTYAELLSIDALEETSMKFESKHNNFIKQNECENVVCKMVVVRTWWYDELHISCFSTKWHITIG